MTVAGSETINVPLGTRAYDIAIGRDNLEKELQAYAKRGSLSRALIVSDNNVAPIYSDRVSQPLESAGVETRLFSLPAGEPTKNLEQLNACWEELLAFEADRDSTLIALGGGVIGDLAGLAAASFMRGIDFVQIPTSLLAQVDSSVGGKVAINLPASKNIVGFFWQPKHVVIDTGVLATLPENEFAAGMAEIVKYGVIMAPGFFEYLESHVDAIREQDAATMSEIIGQSCRLKAEVVADDETEKSGRRAILNYGHTFGHALEAVCGYGTLLHGEAVAIGMECAARLALELGHIDKELLERQRRLLQAFQLPTALPKVEIAAVIDAMSSDKKATLGRPRFILPTKLGHVELFDDIDMRLVEAVLHSNV